MDAISELESLFDNLNALLNEADKYDNATATRINQEIQFNSENLNQNYAKIDHIPTFGMHRENFKILYIGLFSASNIFRYIDSKYTSQNYSYCVYPNWSFFDCKNTFEDY